MAKRDDGPKVEKAIAKYMEKNGGLVRASSIRDVARLIGLPDMGGTLRQVLRALHGQRLIHYVHDNSKGHCITIPKERR